jgi:hypothetical protein
VGSAVQGVISTWNGAFANCWKSLAARCCGNCVVALSPKSCLFSRVSGGCASRRTQRVVSKTTTIPLSAIEAFVVIGWLASCCGAARIGWILFRARRRRPVALGPHGGHGGDKGDLSAVTPEDGT